jgi:CheY-like chemotaxis protein
MKKHIFLIDDDPDELRIFSDALKDLPGRYTCTYASEPSNALKMLKYLNPDIIFIDYNLPGMNGIELLEEIRKTTKRSRPAIYIYSTTVTDRTRSEAFRLGATGCIEKPSTVRKMNVILLSVLESGVNAVS